MQRTQLSGFFSFFSLLISAIFFLGTAACNYSDTSVGPAEPEPGPGWPEAAERWYEGGYPAVQAAIPVIQDAEEIGENDFCSTCHETFVTAFTENNVHRQQKCESCHGPASRHLEGRGKEPGTILSFKTMTPAQSAEVCLKCHEEDACSPGAQWRTSVHAQRGVTCTDCHRNHYNVPPGTPATVVAGMPNPESMRRAIALAQFEEPSDLPSLRGTSNNLGAVAPDICYRCHNEKYDLQRVAGPHQIGGPNGFNCTTCHDPHGNIVEYSRKDLCLSCHDRQSPTMAWHSSTHNLEGVYCTDCHNPHPRSDAPRVVNTSHTSIRRLKRRSMAVDEPETCYKCHAKVYGENVLPSHHPIIEGKMVCSDCHDPHGRAEGNLKEDTVNQVCYRCHAEKEGPFVYEHPPVTENCAYCHNPHGAAANNLLRQPPVYLCLRCHSGHRRTDHPGGSQVDIDGNAALRPGYYTDCTQCHQQIHGSDLPSQERPQTFLR